MPSSDTNGGQHVGISNDTDDGQQVEPSSNAEDGHQVGPFIDTEGGQRVESLEESRGFTEGQGLELFNASGTLMGEEGLIPEGAQGGVMRQQQVNLHRLSSILKAYKYGHCLLSSSYNCT